jgi:hypothetical protein
MGAGFSNLLGEETSPCQEEGETHLPCVARAHNIHNTKMRSKDPVQRQRDFNNAFQAPLLCQMNQMPEFNDVFRLESLHPSLFISISTWHVTQENNSFRGSASCTFVNPRTKLVAASSLPARKMPIAVASLTTWQLITFCFLCRALSGTETLLTTPWLSQKRTCQSS